LNSTCSVQVYTHCSSSCECCECYDAVCGRSIAAYIAKADDGVSLLQVARHILITRVLTCQPLSHIAQLSVARDHSPMITGIPASSIANSPYKCHATAMLQASAFSSSGTVRQWTLKQYTHQRSHSCLVILMTLQALETSSSACHSTSSSKKLNVC
jgi:hypothetical protein